MKQIWKRLTSIPASCLILLVVATTSIGLNTDLTAPPRFDGAGYSVLGDALASGRGYREINKPGSPFHDHFPPGYPTALAILWQFTGRSVMAAHIFSVTCTMTAILLAWKWMRIIYTPGLALMLGLALAVNWTWVRVGGSIQSEPLYLLCELLSVLIAVRATRGDGPIGIGLGAMLATTTLVRQIGVSLAVAIFLDLGLRKRWRVLLWAIATAGVFILPWVAWLTTIHRHSQIVLFTTEDPGRRIIGQAVFYLERLPDQLTGPFVEVGTVFQHRAEIALMVNLWAVVISGVMVWGWVRTLRNARRRLVGTIGFSTLALLLAWPFTEAGRFLIPLVPFLLVGLTEGLADVMTRMGARQSRKQAAMMILVLSVPYSVYSIVAGRAEAQRRTHRDFDLACQWIARSYARWAGLDPTSR